MTAASIALDRFGLGGRPDISVPGDPRGWVSAQLGRYVVRPPVIAAAPTTVSEASAVAGYLTQRRETMAGRPRKNAPRQPGVTPPPIDPAVIELRKDYVRGIRDGYALAVGARTTAALVTPAPFVERLVHFWSNHFAVSADKRPIRALAGPFEFDAIRPHVLGNFRDLLGAVERHPAMLLFLDQAVSVGPNSAMAARKTSKKFGLNENLAREIIELHTLGVRTGYSQADVTEFARALTGWTAAGITQRTGGVGGKPGDFVFVERFHEPGARKILGKTYREGGEAQGQAVLDDLARNPATATHIATKLARHFAGDPPPPAMVARLAVAFTKSDGDLPSVYRAIIASPEAWVDRPVRFRTPWDWSVATLRAIGMTTIEPDAAIGLMNQLGQPVWRPGQPAGFDDIDATWAGPDAVMRRVEAAERFASRSATPIDARKLAEVLHPGALSAVTTQALARAESPAQALALLLVAPEAMRR